MSSNDPLFPTPEDLVRLAEKYRMLGELRREKRDGQAEPPRATFRKLAVDHPGVLKELELLEEDEIARREHALRAASETAAAVEPWMIAIHVFHETLRTAIKAKTRASRSRTKAQPSAPAAPLLDAACAEASERSGLPMETVTRLVRRRSRRAG